MSEQTSAEVAAAALGKADPYAGLNPGSPAYVAAHALGRAPRPGDHLGNNAVPAPDESQQATDLEAKYAALRARTAELGIDSASRRTTGRITR